MFLQQPIGAEKVQTLQHRVLLLIMLFVAVLYVPWWVSVSLLILVLLFLGYSELILLAVLVDGLYSIGGVLLPVGMPVTVVALLVLLVRLLWRSYVL